MSDKNKSFEGSLKNFPNHKIYLNINHLEAGKYTLKIVHKNKVIKKVSFKK